MQDLQTSAGLSGWLPQRRNRICTDDTVFAGKDGRGRTHGAAAYKNDLFLLIL